MVMDLMVLHTVVELTDHLYDCRANGPLHGCGATAWPDMMDLQTVLDMLNLLHG